MAASVDGVPGHPGVDTSTLPAPDPATRSAAPGPGGAPGHGNVAGLDGLRGVAVGLVVLFHLSVPGFAGGFLGVDVFFVLSGFLITSLLLAEHRRHGRISLSGFWSRRVRRLMPALLVLVLALTVWVAVAATESQKASLRGDLLATVGYVANWRIIATSSYFEAVGDPSPVQHAWSLAIEEQFYLVWPLVVVCLLVWLGSRAGRRSRVALLGLATTLAVVSAALLAWRWAPEALDRAYMGTDTRIFEPLVGAAAAVLLTVTSRRPGRVLTITGVLVASVAAVAVVATARGEEGWYFRGGAALLAAAVAVVVMAVWEGRGGAVGSTLSWRPLVWLGALSYGVYLWHWPVMLVLDPQAADGTERWVRSLLVIVLTLLVSVLSYRLIEQPIRSGSLKARLTPRRLLVAVPVSMAVVMGAAWVATTVPPPPPGVPTVLVVGDSVPRRLEPALEREASARGWHVASAARGGCPVTGDLLVYPDGSPLASGDACRDVPAEQDAAVTEVGPDLVVWWDRFAIADVSTADGHLAAGSPAFWAYRDAQLDATVARLGSGGARVVLLGAEPPGTGIASRCTEADCNAWVRRMVDDYGDLTQVWNEHLRAYAQAHPDRASFVSLTASVCRADSSPCDDEVAGRPARPDGTHYEGAGEAVAATAFFDLVTRLPRPGVEAPAAASGPGGTGAVAVRALAQGAAAVGGPASGRAVAMGRVPPPGPAVLIVGDSVPRRLDADLAAAADRAGWWAVNAAHGGCPVTGERIVYPSGRDLAGGRGCSVVLTEQRAAVAATGADVVVWWDRFSVADVMVGGKQLTAGSRAFWRHRERALASGVARLSAGGARVLLVGIEPPGRGIATRCTPKACDPWLRRQIQGYSTITSRWNTMMRRYAAAHPAVARFVSLTPTICKADTSPCDDRRAGLKARPDGTHYWGPGATRVSRAIMAAVVVARPASGA